MTAGRNFFCFKTHGKFQPRTARALFSFSRYRLNRLSFRGFLWKIVVLPQPAWWVVGLNTALRSQRLGRPCSSPLTSPHLPHLTLNPGRRAPVRFCCFCCSRRHFSPAPALASSPAPAAAPAATSSQATLRLYPARAGSAASGGVFPARAKRRGIRAGPHHHKHIEEAFYHE